jgi:hypothetical protein
VAEPVTVVGQIAELVGWAERSVPTISQRIR